jgi:SAM-dependent methyltransferase
MFSRQPELSKQKEYWGKNRNKRRFDHPVVRAFAEQRIDYLARFLDFSQIESAFDYGCGDGFSCYYMSRRVARIEGGDVSELMLRNNPLDASRLHLIDGRTLPFGDRSFDLVYCWEVLHHVDDPLAVVREMARVARRWVVLFEPNRINPGQLVYGLIRSEERGTLRFTTSYLREIAQLAGLRVDHLANVGWIFPNMTPPPLLGLLLRLPFEVPLVTISCCLVASRND